MTAETRIKKLGNSYGIIIPKTILKKLNVRNPDGQSLTMHVTDGKLIIVPQPLPTTIEELFAGFDHQAHKRQHNGNQEVDFVPSVGHEAW